MSDLQVATVPSEFAVGADYGPIVLGDEPPEVWWLALYILSPEAQSTARELRLPRSRPAGGGMMLRLILSLALTLAAPAWARTVTDSYVMKPEALTGWPRALYPEEEA